MGTFPGAVHRDEQELFEYTKVQTTDATITVAWSKVVPDGASLFANAVIVGTRVGGTHRCVYELSAVAYRTTGGNVALATPSTDWATPYYETDTALTTAAVFSVDTSAQTLRLRVTGVAGETYDWRVAVRVVAG